MNRNAADPPSRGGAEEKLRELLVGRGNQADLILNRPEISRRHARLRSLGADTLLEDLGSANGTFVEGHRLQPGQPVRLELGQRVAFGPVELQFLGDRLVPAPPGASPTGAEDEWGDPADHSPRGELRPIAPAREVRVDVQGLYQEVRRRGQPLPLLQDVHFTALPRELVAIVGASGAGKSTLIKALNGMWPAERGTVLYGGKSFYADPDAFRSLIGYVPQEDIIHRELTVERVLQYAGELRLPADTAAEERQKLIEATLAELGLVHRRDARVSTLSGGERKRVNIAVELLTRPSLLLLDEPTSGLDPGLERRVVALLRRLTEEGRTILFVTHATESIAQCDQVLFLANGGRVAFFGPPAAALEFFGVEEFAEAYLKLAGTEEGETDWPERFRESPYYTEYITWRQERPRQLPRLEPEPRVCVPEVGSQFRSGFQQFRALARRYLDVIRGDTRHLSILLLQAPFIATILGFLYKPNTFSNDHSTTPGAAPPVKDAPELLFLIVIAALWFGTINAAREISKERPIFLRERLAGVRIWPYLLSKLAVLALFCVAQSVLLLGIISARVELTSEASTWWLILATLTLTSLVATLQGLLLSGLAGSNDQAVSLVPVVLLPQVIFSGMLISLSDLGPLRAVANVMPGRWAYGGLAALTNLNDLYSQTGIARHAKDVFDTSPLGAMLALSLIGLACLVGTAVVLGGRERR